MANNELAIRFTEGKYATKNEVAKELRMSMIDNIWDNILKYRSDYTRFLPIKSIEKNQLVVCFCPSINSLVNSADMKLIRLMREYSHISPQNGELKRFEDEALIRCLKHVANKHELDVTDAYLRSLIRGDIKEASPSVKILVRYLDALNYIKRFFVNNIDVDFLAELYERLLGTTELTEFYRSVDESRYENRVLIDRIYTSAPAVLIEKMMDSLFNFIASSSLSAATKAAITYYYINYIRPFPEFSDEIALLMAKAILAHSDLGEVGALIPIESLLSENQEEITRIFMEVQKTWDTTYFVNFALKQFDNKCDELLDYIIKLKTEGVRNEFYGADVEKTPTATYTEQKSLFDLANEPEVPPQVTPVIETKPEPQPQIQPQRVEQPKPIEQPKPVEQPKAEIAVELPPQQPVQEQIAVSYIPPALDEKQALRLEQHLLELDPSLRKHEARFYARHCTLGKSYTIAQYKRMIGCVYETARTAMDHLVELGYYRKDSSNKKFIYTPIPRK